MLTVPAQAATLLRDPDIENALSRLARPVLSAAGLSSATKILVIKDPSLNAFVVDRNAIYLHSGLILRTDTPAELQFVIAHEAAHILNGHLTRRGVNAQGASRVATLGMALAMATAAGTGQSALAAAGIGIASSASRRFMVHTRAEEASADQSAIRWLAQSGRGTRGAIALMELFAGQETLAESRRDPYASTHPLSRDRLRTVQTLSQSYGLDPKVDVSEDAYWFARAQGKLSAFLRDSSWTRDQADDSPTQDIRHMRLAVAAHLRAETDTAVAQIDRALALRPDDGFYYELKGQILLEGRRFAAAEAAYRKAAEGAPRDALIQASLGHAMVVQGGASRLRDALPVLERARALDYRNGAVLRDLGSAYAQLGQPGMAALSVSEYHALYGRMEDARIQARRAEGLLQRGSPAWQRAQDVIVAAENAEDDKR